MRSGTIILTGFEPFDNADTNPSFEAVKLLPDEFAGFSLLKLQLPVVFKKAADMLIEEIKRVAPAFVISTGLAAGRKAVTPELIAVNLMDARIPDNAGYKPEWVRISEDSPDGLFTGLPAKEITEAIKNAGIPAELSFSAGTFVCNDLMYRVLDSTKDSGLPFGFIHVPEASVIDPQTASNALTEALKLMISGIVR